VENELLGDDAMVAIFKFTYRLIRPEYGLALHRENGEEMTKLYMA